MLNHNILVITYKMKILLVSMICTVLTISLFSVPNAFAGCIAQTNEELDPQSAVSDGHLYSIYTLVTGCVNAGVFFKTSTDNGTTFSPQVEINNSTEISGNPVITASGNSVYIVWQQFGSNPAVYFSKSTDYGVTFGKPVIVGSDLGLGPSLKKIILTKNYTEVIWADYNFKFDSRQALLSVSTNGGTSFEKPIALSNETEDSPITQIQQSGNTAYVYMDTFEKCPNGVLGCFQQNKLVTFDINQPANMPESIIADVTVPEFPWALVVLTISISFIILMIVRTRLRF